MVYFFYPETAYRSLEEMDAIFHKTSGAKGWLTVVKTARDEPYRYGKKGELLIEYAETDAAQEGRRRSSAVRSKSMAEEEKGQLGGYSTHLEETSS